MNFCLLSILSYILSPYDFLNFYSNYVVSYLLCHFISFSSLCEGMLFCSFSFILIIILYGISTLSFPIVHVYIRFVFLNLWEGRVGQDSFFSFTDLELLLLMLLHLFPPPHLIILHFPRSSSSIVLTLHLNLLFPLSLLYIFCLIWILLQVIFSVLEEFSVLRILGPYHVLLPSDFYHQSLVLTPELEYAKKSFDVLCS